MLHSSIFLSGRNHFIFSLKLWSFQVDSLFHFHKCLISEQFMRSPELSPHSTCLCPPLKNPIAQIQIYQIVELLTTFFPFFLEIYMKFKTFGSNKYECFLLGGKLIAKSTLVPGQAHHQHAAVLFEYRALFIFTSTVTWFHMWVRAKWSANIYHRSQLVVI